MGKVSWCPPEPCCWCHFDPGTVLREDSRPQCGFSGLGPGVREQNQSQNWHLLESKAEPSPSVSTLWTLDWEAGSSWEFGVAIKGTFIKRARGAPQASGWAR